MGMSYEYRPVAEIHPAPAKELEKKKRKDDEKRKKKRIAALKGVFVKPEIELVREAGPEIVNQILEGMLERGEIRMAGISLDEGPNEVTSEAGRDEEPEDDFDGDLEIQDEDEIVEEYELEPSFADGSTPFVEDGFEIVMRRRDGKLLFEAPENDWAGARPVSADAADCLKNYSQRMNAYAAIARRLQELFASKDGDIRLAQLAGALGEQKQFIKDHLDKQATESGLSHYLKNARLVCGDRSVPLGMLFSGGL